MLGLDAKAAKAAWTVFLVALALYTTYLARGPLVVFALALFFSYLIAPSVDFCTRYIARRGSRTTALAFVYVLMVVTLIAAGAAIAGKIAEEAANLAQQLPQFLAKQQDPLAALSLPSWLEPLRERIIVAARDQLRNLDEGALPLIRGALTQVLSQAGNALTVVLIPILAFFFLKDGAELRAMIMGLAAQSAQRDFLDRILDSLHELLASYIRALIALAMSTLVLYSLYFEITGVPYALLLGGISALLEFIPVVGPLVASATVLIVAGASGYQHLSWIIVFLIVFRLFQDYVLQPHLMGQGVQLHPLLVLFGVLAGEKIAGVPGMFFSVPVIAALRILSIEVLAARKQEPPEEQCEL